MFFICVSLSRSSLLLFCSIVIYSINPFFTISIANCQVINVTQNFIVCFVGLFLFLRKLYGFLNLSAGR